MFPDIFTDDAFSLASMLRAIERIETVPGQLGALGLFYINPVRTETVAIEERDGTLSVIKTSPRGAPLDQAAAEVRRIRDFRTTRIAQQDHILASSLAFAREFGTADQVVSVQAEFARRLSGPSGLVASVEATWEHMRLGAVQGRVLDADGSVIYDWHDEFGIKRGAPIKFNLAAADPAAGALRRQVTASVVRPMAKLAKGAHYTGIHALCGAEFFDALIAHPEVRETFLNQQEAAELRTGYHGQRFVFAGVTWEEYAGNDSLGIAIADGAVQFFPAGAGNGIFEVAFAPGEQFGHIGQLGAPIYPLVVPDRDRDAFVDLEVYSYPLFICKRPEMLFRGALGS